MFWKTKNRIELKQNFYSEIKDYYFKVSNKIYDDYKRLWKQYPKSRKRYSKLKIQDTEHPFVYFLITDFLRQIGLIEYRNFSKILLR